MALLAIFSHRKRHLCWHHHWPAQGGVTKFSNRIQCQTKWDFSFLSLPLNYLFSLSLWSWLTSGEGLGGRTQNWGSDLHSPYLPRLEAFSSRGLGNAVQFSHVRFLPAKKPKFQRKSNYSSQIHHVMISVKDPKTQLITQLHLNSEFSTRWLFSGWQSLKSHVLLFFFLIKKILKDTRMLNS